MRLRFHSPHAPPCARAPVPAQPSDIIKLIFDCVGLLKMESVVPVEMAEVTLGIGKEKKTFTFIRDSFKLMQTGMLSDARFLQNIFYFSK